MDILTFEKKAQRAYFPTEDCSHALFTLVNLGFYYILQDFDRRDLLQHGLSETDIDAAIALCRGNAEVMARSTPLLLEHSHEQIQALLFMVSTMWYMSLLLMTDCLVDIVFGDISDPDSISLCGCCCSSCPRCRLRMLESPREEFKAYVINLYN